MNSAAEESGRSRLCVDIPQELHAELQRAAGEHYVDLQTLVAEILSEYTRWERLAQLRCADTPDPVEDFTSWAQQVEFFHARLRQRAQQNHSTPQVAGSTAVAGELPAAHT